MPGVVGLEQSDASRTAPGEDAGGAGEPSSDAAGIPPECDDEAEEEDGAMTGAAPPGKKPVKEEGAAKAPSARSPLEPNLESSFLWGGVAAVAAPPPNDAAGGNVGAGAGILNLPQNSR